MFKVRVKVELWLDNCILATRERCTSCRDVTDVAAFAVQSKYQLLHDAMRESQALVTEMQSTLIVSPAIGSYAFSKILAQTERNYHDLLQIMGE